MSVYGKCYGCGCPVEDRPGNAYCPKCVDKQVEDQEKEREAFEAYHKFADSIAKHTTP